MFSLSLSAGESVGSCRSFWDLFILENIADRLVDDLVFLGFLDFDLALSASRVLDFDLARSVSSLGDFSASLPACLSASDRNETILLLFFPSLGLSFSLLFPGTAFIPRDCVLGASLGEGLEAG